VVECEVVSCSPVGAGGARCPLHHSFKCWSLETQVFHDWRMAVLLLLVVYENV
jgi:hypothetical protein